MAINYELINKGGISLGTNFELLGEKPLDARLVVPSLDGLAHLIAEKAAYAGMIVYVTAENKHYQVNADGTYREFGLTAAELEKIITDSTTAAMEFKGATATLPANPSKGDMYKVAGENINIQIDGVDAKLGDSIVYDGGQWFLIPSGDDIEDTWRPISGVDNESTLTFAAGDKLDKTVTADGTVTYKHAAIDSPELLAENEQTRTYITEVETDGFGHITGYKTATENVVDTNTEYEFTSQVESSSVYFQVEDNKEDSDTKTIYLDAYSKNEADGKFVEKVTGKSLISDDEIARLAEVNNYDDEEVRGLIDDNAKAIEDLSDYVGTIPTVTDENGINKYADLDVIGYINKKAQETLDAASGNSSETAASVKQQLDDYKGENNTRVKNIEDDVATKLAIETFNNYIDGKSMSDEGLKGYADDAAKAVEDKFDEYTEAHKNDYTNEQIDQAIEDATGALGTMSTKDAGDYYTKNDIDGKDFANKTEAQGYATTAQNNAETKAAELDAALKSELEGKINGVDGKFTNYVTNEAHRIHTEFQGGVNADFETRVSALEGKFTGDNSVDAKIAAAVKVETDRATKSEGGLRTDVDAVAGRMTTAESKISDLETASATHALKTEVESVGTELTNYKAAQKLVDDAQDVRIKAIEDTYAKASDVSATYETIENVNKVIENFTAYVESNDAAIADRYTKGEADAKFAIKGEDSYDDTELSNRVKAIEDDYLKAAHKTALEGLITAEQERAEGIEGGLRTDVEAIKADYLKSSDKSELEGKITAEVTRATGVEAGLDSRINDIEDDYLVEADKTELSGLITAEEARAKGVEESLQTQINTIMNNPDAEGAINSINEFTKYVKDHGTIANGFRADIDKNKVDIAANATAISEHEALAAETYETKLDAQAKLEAAQSYTQGYAASKQNFAVGADGLTLSYNLYDDSTIQGKTLIQDSGIYSAGDVTQYSISSSGSNGTVSLYLDPSMLPGEIGELRYSTANYGQTVTKKVAFQEDVDATYAKKATTLEGYGIGDAYTKAEVDTEIASAKADAAELDVVVLSSAQSFATNAVSTLAGAVYTKTETYTQTEVDAAISTAITSALTWGEF